MERIRFTAKTLEEAITKACVELGVTSEYLDYVVEEQGSSGVFGIIGSRPCVISAKVSEGSEETDETGDVPEKAEIKAEIKVKPEPEKIQAVSENVIKEDMEDMIPAGDPSEKAEKFLNGIFKSMDMDVNIETSFDKMLGELNVNLTGDSMGMLIGKRGQTLDALQYLTGQVVNKHEDVYIRVKLDTEKYRDRRKDTLETLALNIAQKVKRTRRPVALEPMNPYERRIIHSVLQGEKDITTRSEGEEPYRHVVVCCVKKKK